MQTFLTTDREQTQFIITDLDPRYYQYVRGLAFQPVAEGFARSFPSDTPQLAAIYQQFSRAIEPMLRQAAHELPVPWEQALQGFLERVDGSGIDWWLTGSTALAVRGIAVSPGDIDLMVDDAGAQRLGELFCDTLVEPLQAVQGWICRWWGRAFLHARLEWVGGVTEAADQPLVGDCGPNAAQRLETIIWHGTAIRVPPLDLQLAVSQRRGLTERVAQIQQHLQQGKE